MRRSLFALLAALLIASLALTACNGGAPTEEPATVEPADDGGEEAPVDEEPVDEEPVDEEPADDGGDVVQIRWFVGLGTGASPEQMPAQEELVEQFNAEHDDIELIVEFVVNDQAPDTLKTQIAGGNPPDIIGPVGQSGVNEFSGLFLDLTPYLEDYDWSDFDQGSIDAYRMEGVMEGIPFAVYPSAIFYNRDLLDEAGLEYPPHEWGGDYADGDVWDTAKLEELALLLTVDENGNDATDPDFDPENIVQFGYNTQWTLPRGEATALFGADYLVDDEGNAMISDRWRDAFRWYYEAMHEDHFIPNATYRGSDLLAAGNPFDSGNVALTHCHLWYKCCVGNVPNWDVAAVPSYGDGELISKLHADTFRVMKATEHPEEAVEVLKWLVGEAAGPLLDVYGGFPARLSLQEDFIAGLDAQFEQGVDWQVFIDGLAYPDIPNHEANLPNYAEAFDRLQAFQSLYQSDPDLDIDAELDTLESDLQAIFAAAD